VEGEDGFEKAARALGSLAERFPGGGREELLGPDNPSTLTTLNNLTGLYDEMENHGQAEKAGKSD
jgi:hypothetical protein